MIKKIIVFALAAAFVAASAQTQDQTKVELKLKLPKPMFIGTPRNIRTPNLEAVTGKPRGPFFVPAGTSCCRSGNRSRRATRRRSSGSSPSSPTARSRARTAISSNSGRAKQWVRIDLKESAALRAILVWHYHSQARVYRDVVVQVSDDKDFVTGVTTLFNNDHDNTLGAGDREGQGVHRDQRGPADRRQGRQGAGMSGSSATATRRTT